MTWPREIDIYYRGRYFIVSWPALVGVALTMAGAFALLIRSYLRHHR